MIKRRGCTARLMLKIANEALYYFTKGGFKFPNYQLFRK
jgi:hypothetical protein